MQRSLSHVPARFLRTERGRITIMALGLGCLAATRSLNAEITTLTFDAPVPGTIRDVNGQRTGFIGRLPGTGSSFPANGGVPGNDPNLVLDAANGHLLVQSTRSNFAISQGWDRNLAGMEAPGMLLSGIGSQDFVVQAHYLDLHVDQESDQIGVYVGITVDLVVRGGVHEGPLGYQAFSVYEVNGVDVGPGGGASNQFLPGQNGMFEIGRIGGIWHYRWQNLSDPSFSGSIDLLPNIPELDSQNNLYVGVFNHDARNFTPQTAILDSLIIRTGVDVPEPASLALFALASIILCRRSVSDMRMS